MPWRPITIKRSVTGLDDMAIRTEPTPEMIFALQYLAWTSGLRKDEPALLVNKSVDERESICNGLWAHPDFAGLDDAIGILVREVYGRGNQPELGEVLRRNQTQSLDCPIEEN
jgi:hypothetical protein